MNLKALKYGAAVGVAMMGISGFLGQAQAQTVIQANITVDSAITVTPGLNIEFGTWLLVYRNADPFELTMDTAGNIVVNNIAAGAGNSVAIQLTPGTGAGNLTVNLPTGANGVTLNMSRGAITNFGGGGLTLQNITYGTTIEGANQVFAQSPTLEPVTVVTGGTPQTVSFGAEIAVASQPVNGPASASFTVSFAY